MEDSHRSTCIANRLTKPHYIPINRILPQIQLLAFICVDAVIFVYFCNGEGEKKRFDGARDKGKEFGVGDAEDVVEAHLRGETEGVDILSEDIRVRFKRNPFLLLSAWTRGLEDTFFAGGLGEGWSMVNALAIAGLAQAFLIARGTVATIIPHIVSDTHLKKQQRDPITTYNAFLFPLSILLKRSKEMK
jgi:hypothetical protein